MQQTSCPGVTRTVPERLLITLSAEIEGFVVELAPLTALRPDRSPNQQWLLVRATFRDGRRFPPSFPALSPGRRARLV
jgi:hypothetical protein